MICVFCVSLSEDNKLIERVFFFFLSFFEKSRGLNQQSSLWMPADLGWRLGARFKRLCLQTIKNHINLNCQRRNGFQKLLTASTAPP